MPVTAPATTERVGLARLAEVMLGESPRVDAVAGPHGLWVTGDGDRLIRGVVAISGHARRIELTLHVNVLWPVGSLDELAGELREKLSRAARTAGFEGSLGPVAVCFHDVVFEPSDVAEAS